jgi:hypothetical protein
MADNEYTWLFDNQDPLNKGGQVKRVIASDDPAYRPETEEFQKKRSNPFELEETKAGVDLPGEDFASQAQERLEKAVSTMGNHDTDILDALTTIIEKYNTKNRVTSDAPKEEQVKALLLDSLNKYANDMMIGDTNIDINQLRNLFNQFRNLSAEQIIQRLKSIPSLGEAAMNYLKYVILSPNFMNMMTQFTNFTKKQNQQNQEIAQETTPINNNQQGFGQATADGKAIKRVGKAPIDNGNTVLDEAALKAKAITEGMTPEEIKIADSVIDSVFNSDNRGFRKLF